MKKLVCFLSGCLLLLQSEAQKKSVAKMTANTPPALVAIRESDLKKDLYEMASDHFRGREAGTLDELKVSMRWADRLRSEGLQPTGDDSTYFQYFNLYRNRISPASTVSINGTALKLWTDVLVAQTAPANVSAPIVFVGKGSKEELDKADVKGKAVAIQASTEGLNLNVSLPERRYPGYVYNKYRTELTNRGVAAVIFIADEMGEKSWSQVVPALSRGLYDVEGGPNTTVGAKPPVLWVHANALSNLQNGATLTANILVENFLYPSVNIVAKVAGTDAQLKNEYVLFSGRF